MSESIKSKSLGAFGLLAFAFFGWLSTAAFSFAEILLLISLLLNTRSFFNTMKKETLFWFSLSAIVYLLIHWWFYLPMDEYAAKFAKDHTRGLIYLWLFSVISWNLQYREMLIRWMICLASTGLILKVIIRTDWRNLAVFFGQRQGFGFTPAGMGLHSALALWGLSFVGIYLFRNVRGSMRWVVAVATLFGVLVLAQALLLTESRTAWVSIVVAVLFTAFFLLLREGDAIKTIGWRKWLAASLVFLILFASLVSVNYQKLSSRITAEETVYEMLLSLDRNQIPYSGSVGIRAHMLLYGTDLWLQKPFLGWGVGISRSLLAQDKHFRDTKQPHFHNTYLELLLEQGLTGFMFYAIAFFLLMHGFNAVFSIGVVPEDLFYYLVGAWVMVLVWSFADSRMIHSDVRFVLWLLSSITFSFTLKRYQHSV